jgi:O-antigen/teichoic acid export membrane protein
MIRRVFSSLGISGLIFLVTMAVQIISVPVFLHYWGAQLYGEWITLTNIVSNLNILNAGVQAHVLNTLIGHYSRREIPEGTQLLHAALRLYTLLCSIAFATAIGLAFFPSIAAILNIHILTDFQVRLIIIIEGALAAYTILEGLLMSLLIVIHQQPRRLLYSLVEKLLLFGQPLVTAILRGGPTQATLWSALGLSMVAAYQVRDVSRRSPFRPGLRESSWREAFALLGPGLTFLAVSFSFQMLTSGVILLISVLIGSTAVALFTTTLVLSNLARSICNMALNVLWPEITSMAVQDAQRLADWHHIAQKMIGTLVLCFSVGLLLLGPFILTYWTQSRIQIDPVLNNLLVLYLCVQFPSLVARTFGLATNRQGQLFRIEFSIALATLFLAVAEVPYMGMYAIPVALIIAQAGGTIIMLFLATGWTSDSVRSLMLDVLLRSMPVLIMLAISVFFAFSFADNFIIRLVSTMLVCFAALVMSWRTWFSREDRDLFTRHLPGNSLLKGILS